MRLPEPVSRCGPEALSQTVILAPFLRMGKNGIGLVDLLHQFLTVWVFIRMIAERKIAVGFLYFIERCSFAHAQYPVIREFYSEVQHLG